MHSIRVGSKKLGKSYVFSYLLKIITIANYSICPILIGLLHLTENGIYMCMVLFSMLSAIDCVMSNDPQTRNYTSVFLGGNFLKQ
jgi:hypothetical protein